MIEEPCEGKLQARFCEGKRINKYKRWIGEAELEDEIIFVYPASYSTLAIIIHGFLLTSKVN